MEFICVVLYGVQERTLEAESGNLGQNVLSLGRDERARKDPVLCRIEVIIFFRQ